MIRAGITEELILMEFVKFDKSETLRKKEREESEKYETTKNIFMTNGAEIKDQQEITIEQRTISYSHPPVDSDTEDVFGP